MKPAMNQGQQFQRPKVDAHFYKDSRSRNYGIRTLIPPQGDHVKARFWAIPKSLPLNQRAEGACVGFGWAGELAVDPVTIPVWDGFARGLYTLARSIDQAEGRVFLDGATVLAGAKACKVAGHISGYHACFGMDEFNDALSVKGPVVLGINWYEGMYETEPSGLMRVNGPFAGGHCLLVSGWADRSCLDVRATTPDLRKGQALVKAFGGQTIYELPNSWGWSFGIGGVGYMRESDMRRLLIDEEGESFIATDISPTPAISKWKQRLTTVLRELHI